MFTRRYIKVTLLSVNQPSLSMAKPVPIISITVIMPFNEWITISISVHQSHVERCNSRRKARAHRHQHGGVFIVAPVGF